MTEIQFLPLEVEMSADDLYDALIATSKNIKNETIAVSVYAEGREEIDITIFGDSSILIGRKDKDALGLYRSYPGLADTIHNAFYYFEMEKANWKITQSIVKESNHE